MHCGEQGTKCSCGALPGRWVVVESYFSWLLFVADPEPLFFLVNFVPKNTVFLGFQQSEDRR